MDTVASIETVAVKAPKEEVILIGDDVYLIDIDPTLVYTQVTKASSIKRGIKPKPYYRATFRGAGMMVSPEFKDLMDAGELVEVRLTKGSYNPTDPDDTTKTLDARDSWQFTGKKTATQVIKSKMHSRRVQVIEHTAIGDVTFNDSLFAMVQKASVPVAEVIEQP